MLLKNICLMDLTSLRFYLGVLCLILNGWTVAQPCARKANHSDVPASTNGVPPDLSSLEREGHDKHVEKFLFPVLLGFKLSGLATATFAILKIFVLQALLASKAALLGAVLLASKALYVYLRDKFWKNKHPKLETYPYQGLVYPYHWPQWDWPEYYPHPHTDDYYSQASHPEPYKLYNDSFATRVDRIKITTSSPQAEGINHNNYFARITETTYD